MSTLSNVIWPLGAAQFILGVLVVKLGESAIFVLKVMKIQCFFSISLDPKRPFGPYYELVKMDLQRLMDFCIFCIYFYMVYNFVNKSKEVHSVLLFYSVKRAS